MKRHDLARVFALVFCFYLLFSIPAAFLRADDSEKKDYKKDDSDDNAIYYIIDGESVDDLFDFKIKDVKNVLEWAFEFKTFTVIKQNKAEDASSKYKVYFNTPNLQMLAKNEITHVVNDGYTDETYDPNENEWIVKVGKNADTENAITKYGFSIPSYTYWGEYPHETMTTAGVLPTNWLGAIWRFIKSLFGFSYIKAPDADNFNTISYYNHGYKDNDAFILDFLKKYYLRFFVDSIADDRDIEDQYFTGPQDVLKRVITKEAYEQAKDYIKQNQNDYLLVMEKKKGYDTFIEKGATYPNMESWVAGGFPKEVNAFYMDYENGDSGDFGTVKSELVGGQDAAHWMANHDAYLKALYDYYFVEYNTETGSVKQFQRLAYAYANVYAYIIKHNDADRNFEAFGIKTKNGSSDDLISFKNALEHILLGYNENNSMEFQRVFIEAVCVDPNVLFTSYGSLYMQGETADEGDTAVTAATGNPQNRTYYIVTEGSDKIYFTGWSVFDFYTSNLAACFYKWTAEDWLTDTDREFIRTYEENLEVQGSYDNFVEIMENGSDQKIQGYTVDERGIKVPGEVDYNPNIPIPYILYNQCLIPNTGSDGDCTSSKYGAETSLSVADVYVYSGLWEITKDWTPDTDANGKWNNPNPLMYEDRYTLTEEAVIKVLNNIKNYTGPYYTDVITNILKLMINRAEYEKGTGEDLKEEMYNDDPRVMPFDTSTLTRYDRENYQCNDPRVEIYKNQLVGMMVTTSNGELNLGIPDISMYIAPQKTIVNITGTITELSVFMQQLISFEFFESIGLSPTTMWEDAFISLAVGGLVLVFLIATCISFLRAKKGLVASIIGAIFLFTELGFFFMLSSSPDKVWGTIKKVENMFIYLGESTTLNNDETITYLFGDAEDMEVFYYLPYLDSWSKYNTGYGLKEDQQLINTTTDTAELLELDDGNWPTIGSQKVKHYSVMLMDAFNYYGTCNSPLTSIALPVGEENGEIIYKTYNGIKINNNAYRVVDHFMAPRVKITEKEENKTLSMTVVQNENYNGEFQNGIIDLFVKLLNAILMCFLSLIKLLTFVWQWFLLYVLIFKVLFSRTAERKTWKEILLETFAPTLALICIGFYAGMTMTIGMTASGLLGIMLEIALFMLTFALIKWWHNAAYGRFFPKTMVPIYFLTNMKDAQRNRSVRKMEIEADQARREAGMDTNGHRTLDEETDELFDENGKLKDRYITPNERDKKVLENWYQRAYRTETGIVDGDSRVLSEKTRRAKAEYERLYEEDAKHMRTAIDMSRKGYKNKKNQQQKRQANPENYENPGHEYKKDKKPEFNKMEKGNYHKRQAESGSSTTKTTTQTSANQNKEKKETNKTDEGR